MLAFTGAIDDAAHHRHPQAFDAGVLLAPDRHLRPQEVVNLLGQFLKGGAGGASAAWACRDAGHKGAQAERLEDFRSNHDFLGTGFTRLRRE